MKNLKRNWLIACIVLAFIAIVGTMSYLGHQVRPTEAETINVTPVVGPAGATGSTGPTGPAGPSTIASPASRSLSYATAYQCTDTTKPCIITVTLTSSVSFSLSGTTTNTATMLVGSTNAVASGTGTTVGTYTNSVGGTIVIGLVLNTQATQSYTLNIPIGWYFALRTVSGTVTIVSAYEQALG